MAKRAQEKLSLQKLYMLEMYFDNRKATRNGSSGKNLENQLKTFLLGKTIWNLQFKVALKRKQAAEDAIALGLRMRQNSSSEEPKLGFLAPGPVFPDGKLRNINITYLNFKYLFLQNISAISSNSPPRSTK